jgi:anti-sigma regulatory factor (Ser/Thr protein kinase)
MQTPALGTLVHRSFVRVYRGRAEQVAAVRADLRRLLGDTPLTDDALLCASELAANAVRHSASGQPGGHFTIRADLRPGCWVRIEVKDQGGPWAGPAEDLERGHGLDIVRRIAADWGAEGGCRSRALWALLNWPADGLGPPAGPAGGPS